MNENPKLPELSVAIASEQVLLREGMKALFADTHYKICIELNTISDVIEAANDRAELVFIGSVLQNEILDPLKALRAVYPRARIVFYAQEMRLPVNALVDIFGSSLDGCLASDTSCDVLRKSIDLIMMGEAIFSFSLLFASAQLGRVRKYDVREHLSADVSFSNRELEVLNFLRTGQPNKLIARALQISEATVKVYIKSMLRKIGASNRTQVAVWAMRNCAVWGDDAGDEFPAPATLS